VRCQEEEIIRPGNCSQKGSTNMAANTEFSELVEFLQTNLIGDIIASKKK
jgi:hypothetical protein